MHSLERTCPIPQTLLGCCCNLNPPCGVSCRPPLAISHGTCQQSFHLILAGASERGTSSQVKRHAIIRFAGQTAAGGIRLKLDDQIARLSFKSLRTSKEDLDLFLVWLTTNVCRELVRFSARHTIDETFSSQGHFLPFHRREKGSLPDGF